MAAFEEIVAVTKQWYRGRDQKHAATMASVYAEDARLIPHNESPVVGRDAIRTRFEQMFQDDKRALSLEYETPRLHVTEGDTLAYMYQFCHCPNKSCTYSIVDVFRRIDGKWWVVLSMWNIPTPLAS